MTDTRKTAAKGRARASSDGFSAEERAAMKDRATELRRKKGTAADGAADLQAAIAKMPEPDRGLAEGVHAVIVAAVPDLEQKTWYGFPAYAKGGALLCFFKPASKFKTRFCTVEFTDKARLDDGVMWPTAFALTELTPAAEAKITALVQQAAR